MNKTSKHRPPCIRWDPLLVTSITREPTTPELFVAENVEGHLEGCYKCDIFKDQHCQYGRRLLRTLDERLLAEQKGKISAVQWSKRLTLVELPRAYFRVHAYLDHVRLRSYT